jgi:hypothetical protein
VREVRYLGHPGHAFGAGGRNSSHFVADPDRKLLWHHKAHRERTIELWKTIAKRYRDRTIVAGYDLLNEPAGCKPKHLVGLYEQIIAAIREVDPHHMVMLEGLKFSMDFSMFDRVLDPNQAYAFHNYWLYPFSLIADDLKEELVRTLGIKCREQGCPMLNTEFGAQTAEWIGECAAIFEDRNNLVSGWVFWPWKRTPEPSDKYRHLVVIEPPQSWKTLMKWVAFPLGRKPSKKLGLRAFDEFLEAAREVNAPMDQEIYQRLMKAPRKRQRPR